MLLEFRRVLDPALPHRNRRGAQAAVLLAVALMLFLAFRLAVVRGFDHAIGTDAWGGSLGKSVRYRAWSPHPQSG